MKAQKIKEIFNNYQKCGKWLLGSNGIVFVKLNRE